MPLGNADQDKVIAAVWLIITLIVAFSLTGLFPSEILFLGMPWIVILSIICQISLLGLFYFISKRLWKSDEEGS